MNFGDEKRILLGWLALLAPLPLPLNDALEWPVLFVFVFLVIHFLRRVDQGQKRWLPNSVLNIAGLVYFPILAIDLYRTMLRNQPVKALLHLMLFLLVAKLYSMRKEKDKWTIFVLVFLVFVAAMATSSHATIFFYLVASLIAGFAVMSRFAQMHVLGRSNSTANAETRFTAHRRTLAAAVIAVIILAIPIFSSLPRLREPLLMGQGGGNLALSRTTGFSDQVDLSLTSELRGNRAVALRLQTAGRIDTNNLRLKAATLDTYSYQDRIWDPDPRDAIGLRPDAEGRFELADSPVIAEATIFLEPLRSSNLVMPLETVAFSLGPLARSVSLSGGGAVSLQSSPPRQMLSYTLDLGAQPIIVAREPSEQDSQTGSVLNFEGLSPRIVALAAQVSGAGSAEDQVDNLLNHLLREYSYTLDFVDRDGEKPLEDFLFTYKSGHCEYFASSLVLMLRSQGIPARLVTGFLGAERNNLEDSYVVRQQNAHAWVEAFTPQRGWQVYDPTPPDGRPAAAERGLRLFLQQLYDYVILRWDRYVLTYGAEDQRGFFQEIKQRLSDWWQNMRGQDTETSGPESEPGFNVPTPGTAAPGAALWTKPSVRYGGLAALTLLLTISWLRIRRRILSPEEAYEQLRRGLSGSTLEIDSTTAPFELRRRATRAYPETETLIRQIVELYIASSFAGQSASREQRQPLRRAVDDVLATVARLERQARKQAAKEAALSSSRAA